MDYDTFLGEVQNLAEFPSQEDAVRVTRITLELLSRRIQPTDADNLAAQLPEEIGRHLEMVDEVDRFDWDEFVDRFVEAGGYNPDSDEGEAVHHARSVIAVIDEATAGGTLEDIRDGLPADDDWDELFEYVDQEEPPIPEEQRSE